MLLLVDESGLGQIGCGDKIGEDPRLKLNDIYEHDVTFIAMLKARLPFSENLLKWLRG